jgi:tetratricopeptide (TPR) repeat protein
VPPRRLDPDIPIDLETILLKATAKEPAGRYHRAEQLAEDLNRFLDGRPILARRTSALERFTRWCRRNPAVALLSASVVGLLATGVVILAMSNARIRRESDARNAAIKELQTALSDKDEALGKVLLYRGLYEMDGSQEATLANFDKAMALAPHNPDILWLRGFSLGGWGRWDEALADMTKARSQLGNSKLITPAARDWFVAMVYLAKGDRTGYQAACRETSRKISLEPSADERGTLLWMCTVVPDAGVNASQFPQLAALVLTENDQSPSCDRMLAAGAGMYRAGKLAQAQGLLKEAITKLAEGSPTEDSMSIADANLFLAMTESRLGLAAQAGHHLDEANNLAKTIRPPCWVSKLQVKLLKEVAQSLCDGSR